MDFHSHHHPHLARAEEHTFSHSHITALRAFNVLAFLFALLLNIFGYSSVFRSGLDAVQVSAWYHTYLTPAPWAFYIWVLIYVLQGIFVVYQAIPMFNTIHSNNFLARLSFFFPVALVLEGLWLVSFVYEWMWLALILMVTIAVMFGIAYKRLFCPPLHLIQVLQSHEYLRNEKMRLSFYWAIFHLPTSMNFAWVMLLTMTNFLVFLHWMNVVPAVWLPILLIVVLAIIGMFYLVWFRDAIITLTLSWGLFGIGAHHPHNAGMQIAGYFVGSILLLASVLVIVLLSLRVWRGRAGLDVGDKGPLLTTSSH